MNSENNYKKHLFDLNQAIFFSPIWIKKPYSWVGHIPLVAWLINLAKPKVVVELGSHTGNSYFSICQSVQEYSTGSKCFAVDTWQGDSHSMSYGEEVFNMVREHNEANYSSFSSLLRMTFDQALSHFQDNSVDLLHIDGLHTYESVKHDFESWFPKLAPGAIVLFHDTHVRRDDFGVWKLWDEIKERFPYTFEFENSNGLGVLYNTNATNVGPNYDFIIKNKNNIIVPFFKKIGLRFEDSIYKEIYLHRSNKLQAKLDSMENSMSWKLTSPLRAVHNTFIRKLD
jgi:hypothetical protein